MTIPIASNTNPKISVSKSHQTTTYYYLWTDNRVILETVFTEFGFRFNWTVDAPQVWQEKLGKDQVFWFINEYNKRNLQTQPMVCGAFTPDEITRIEATCQPGESRAACVRRLVMAALENEGG
jgi:hypothetical protein